MTSLADVTRKSVLCPHTLTSRDSEGMSANLLCEVALVAHGATRRQ